MYEDFRDNFVDRGDGARLAARQRAGRRRRAAAPVFSGMFARRTVAMNVGANGQTERVPGELVSGTYFQVLGVGAAIGRVITPDDDKERGGSPVAVLSYDYWRNRFGADPHIVGKTIAVSNHALTIIGVSQAGFDGVDIGYVPSIRVPLMMKAQMTPNWDDVVNRRSRWVNVFGRLKPGVTLDAGAKRRCSRSSTASSSRRCWSRRSATRRAYTREQFLKGQVDLLPAAQGRSPIRQQLSQPLWLLLGIVGGVLLIACANVASLLIARATARAEGDCRAARSRRQPRTHRRPAARRERDAGGDRRAARPRDRVVDDEVPARFPADVGNAARDFGIDRLPDPAVQLRAVAGDRPGVRPRAGAAIDEAEPRADTEGSGRRGCRRLGRRAAAQGAGRRAGHGVGAAAHQRGPVHPQPPGAAAPRSRPEAGQPDRVQRRRRR